jgi:CBS domain-containing protein
MNAQGYAELAQIAKDVRAQQPRQATVRTILSWFDAKRRGYWITQQVRDAFKNAGLTTEPAFENTYIDSEVRFRPLTLPPVGNQQGTNGGSGSTLTEAEDSGVDPIPRIGLLKSANQAPVSIGPDATLAEAATLMMMHDYSQLPVMQGERNVKGMISWKGIGHATAVGRSPKLVREAMEAQIEIVPQDAPLFETVATIIAKEVVLVKGADQKICGIVTGEDINAQFLELSEAFLRLGEIENQIRRLIRGKFTKVDLEAARDPADIGRAVEDVSDLTFGEYVRLFENPSSWTKLGLSLDRAVFVGRLNDVRRIRNEVMHFHPDGIEDEERDILRRTSRFLQQL